MSVVTLNDDGFIENQPGGRAHLLTFDEAGALSGQLRQVLQRTIEEGLEDGPACDSSGCRVDRLRLLTRSSLHRVHRSSPRPRSRTPAEGEERDLARVVTASH